MGYHFSHKVGVDLIGGTGRTHLRKHPLHNPVHSALKGTQILLCVRKPFTAAYDLSHTLNTLGLLCYNLLCNLLQGQIRCIIQDIT